MILDVLLGAEFKNHFHFEWKSILSLMPHVPSRPKPHKTANFVWSGMVLQMIFNSEFDGKITSYFFKIAPIIWPLMTWFSDFWGLVQVWTELTRILKINKSETKCHQVTKSCKLEIALFWNFMPVYYLYLLWFLPVFLHIAPFITGGSREFLGVKILVRISFSSHGYIKMN